MIPESAVVCSEKENKLFLFIVFQYFYLLHITITVNVVGSFMYELIARLVIFGVLLRVRKSVIDNFKSKILY